VCRVDAFHIAGLSDHGETSVRSVRSSR
jgi:hypothetical protein